MMKIALLALASTALFAVPAIASAAEPTSVVITTADLNLARAAGQATFAKRLDRAAQSACERPFIRDLTGMVAYERCITDVKDQAQRQIASRSRPVGLEIAAR